MFPLDYLPFQGSVQVALPPSPSVIFSFWLPLVSLFFSVIGWRLGHPSRGPRWGIPTRGSQVGHPSQPEGPRWSIPACRGSQVGHPSLPEVPGGASQPAGAVMQVWRAPACRKTSCWVILTLRSIVHPPLHPTVTPAAWPHRHLPGGITMTISQLLWQTTQKMG